MWPSVETQCPYCRAVVGLQLETSAEEHRFTHPCPACERVMLVVVNIDEDGVATATTESQAGA